MILDDIVAGQKNGQARGITSVCSANPFVLEAVLRNGLDHDQPVLIESTCNQVNQFGGYMGMTPADFVAHVKRAAEKLNFPQQRLHLGGDHLGPHVWQGEPAIKAMQKSRQLVQDYVAAGYTKIHLDTSMRCADDPPGALPVAVAAERTADLVEAALATAMEQGNHQALRFVIGTEVPAAGGAQVEGDPLEVTRTEDLDQTIQAVSSALQLRGLESAWEQVLAVVVQPGVEFGMWEIHAYDRTAATGLRRCIEGMPMVFEAHSTDYQTRDALRALVEDHFAILKVGPALTFACREAIFALAMIEDEMFPAEERSQLIGVIEEVMLANPVHWGKYYQGSEVEMRLARKFSFSDRIRYYWPDQRVQRSMSVLFNNLTRKPPPWALLSQYLPRCAGESQSGKTKNLPLDCIQSAILRVLGDYDYATGG